MQSNIIRCEYVGKAIRLRTQPLALISYWYSNIIIYRPVVVIYSIYYLHTIIVSAGRTLVIIVWYYTKRNAFENTATNT